MITRFDHAIIAVRDLEDAIRRYRGVGFDVRSGGRHTGRGTHNALIRFGLDYLELIAIDNIDEARAAGQTALVDFLAAGSGGLAGFALATHDIDSDAEHLRQAGVPALGPFAMERLRPDGKLLSWRVLVPRGEIWRRPWPFLIQWDQPDEQRLAWDATTGHSNGAQAVAGLTVIARDFGATASLWREGFRLQLESLSNERALVRLGAQTIELLAGTEEGPSELRVATHTGHSSASALPDVEARLVLVPA
jgi:catechol 2,3-dioxygenase-like lactoylglutathione lyase family enzyme